MSQCPSDPNDLALIQEVAGLLALHKLVPFFGAGLSREHLGFAASELAKEMAAILGCSNDTLLSDLADVFVDQRGEDEFVEFLRDRLVVTELIERKASGHRVLASLMLNLLYTTNQDNLFELVASQFGRHYRRVVTVEDLSDAQPGEPLLIKFHGDPVAPESLVFGRRSYRKRMDAEDHPLDIKLRADLIGKRLLFLGYSLQDENIAKIFDSVKRVFRGTLPSSYLIAFDEDPALLSTARQYQVKVIVPHRLFSQPLSNKEAFERCLQMLCTETRKRQIERGLDDLRSDGPINPRTVIDYEVEATASAVDSEPFDRALESFRASFDQTHIPEAFQEEVTNLFVRLVARADPTCDDEMSGIRGALFNLRLPAKWALVTTASVMAACNKRPIVSGYDSYSALICPALPDHAMPLAAAVAVAMLAERNETVTESFRCPAGRWFDGYERLDQDAKDSVVSMIKIAWTGQENSSPLSHNLSRSFGPRKSYQQILAELERMLPKRPHRPKE